MDRIELFDKLFKERYENSNGFCDIRTIAKQDFNFYDEFLVESIADEMNNLGWVELSSDSDYDLRLNFKGQQAFEKYGSYSSFLRSENRRIKSGKWINMFNNAKTIIAIITGLGMFILAINKYYFDDVRIESQEEEIKRLNLVIGSLENELKESKEIDTIP